jgi:hypothetical protein
MSFVGPVLTRVQLGERLVADLDVCCVCLEKLEVVPADTGKYTKEDYEHAFYSTSCKHVFHAACAAESLQSGAKCPVCRAPWAPQDARILEELRASREHWPPAIRELVRLIALNNDPASPPPGIASDGRRMTAVDRPGLMTFAKVVFIDDGHPMVMFGFPWRLTSHGRVLEMSESSKTLPYPETVTRPQGIFTRFVDVKDIVSVEAAPPDARAQYLALRKVANTRAQP